MISHASHQDLAEILSIYNDVIRNSTAVYTQVELSAAGGEAWLAAKIAGGFPVLAARDSSGVTGFGTFGEFRAWPCYRHSVEHSVHVRPDRRGQGIGKKLVVELMNQALSMRKHIMIAGIDADNAVSIKLHESLGFSKVGHFHEVAFKFGRWLDLVFMECRLPATSQKQSVLAPQS
ncbi:MAG TPA: GNAT family N-acetyltransferase [Steroidobacteraceae bacterium]|jgi:phosphinothricin acetyltransferase|nr:GNAT family N-acetyltransferase [Steroidobacteraceae bacterium]